MEIWRGRYSAAGVETETVLVMVVVVFLPAKVYCLLSVFASFAAFS